MAHDVFISYATENKAIADATCAALEARGIRCWIAPRDVRPGSAFPVAISKAIAAARVTIVVLSGDANRSPHVRKEALLAFKAGAHIIPLRVENVIPGEGLEYVLEGEHWLDAMTPPLETHLRTLADTIGAVLSLQPAASPPAIDLPREQTSGKSDRPVPDPVDTADTVDSEKPSRGPLASRGMLAAIVLGLITIVGLVVLIPTLKKSGAGPPQSTTTGSPKPQDPPPEPDTRRTAELGVNVSTDPARVHLPGKGDMTGVQIAEVRTGSAAERAGLRVDDVMTAVEGQRVQDADAFVKVIASASPGSTIVIDFVREARLLQVSAVLLARGERLPPEQTEISLAGEWEYQESTRTSSGITCTIKAVLSLDESAERQSGKLTGIESCSDGINQRFSAPLEGAKTSGTRITFGIGTCRSRNEGTISETGTRITGSVQGCGLLFSGTWEAVRR